MLLMLGIGSIKISAEALCNHDYFFLLSLKLLNANLLKLVVKRSMKSTVKLLRCVSSGHKSINCARLL